MPEKVRRYLLPIRAGGKTPQRANTTGSVVLSRNKPPNLRPGQRHPRAIREWNSFGLTRISHHLSAEARDRPAITSWRLLAVLNAGSTRPPLLKRRAPPTDGLLSSSPRRVVSKAG